MALSGISTLGIRFSYASEVSAGVKPAAFTTLTRINSIGGLTAENETIDASALEDGTTQYVAGRGETGGNIIVTVNITPDTIDEWETLMSDAQDARENNKQTWFQVYSPALGGKAFFFTADPPSAIPLPESGQNELWTVEMSLTVNEYKGLLEAVV